MGSPFGLRSKRRNGAFLKTKIAALPKRAIVSKQNDWRLDVWLAFSEKTAGCPDRIRAPFSGTLFIWGLDPGNGRRKKARRRRHRTATPARSTMFLDPSHPH